MLPHPVLAGNARLHLDYEALRPLPGGQLWHLLANPNRQLSAAVFAQPFRHGQNLPELAEAAYRELLQLEDQHQRPIARLWNFIPEIHQIIDGLENYRRFNLGRARAFDAVVESQSDTLVKSHGDDRAETSPSQRMPAATGIGIPGQQLILAARFDQPGLRHLENPQQIPAWQYPPEHGPRPPSFARATVSADGRRAWLAGTAAVLGHQSQGRTLEEQLKLTWANIRTMEAHFPADLRPTDFTAWLRHPQDAAALASSLQQELPASTTWRTLQADICRQELLVEIEGRYTRP